MADAVRLTGDDRVDVIGWQETRADYFPRRTAPARPGGLGHLAALGAGWPVLARGVLAARRLRPGRRVVDRGPRWRRTAAHRPALPAARLRRRHPPAPGERPAAHGRRHPSQPGHRDRRRVHRPGQRERREGAPAAARDGLGRGSRRPRRRHRRLQLRLLGRLPGPARGRDLGHPARPRHVVVRSAGPRRGRTDPRATAGSTTSGSPTAPCGSRPRTRARASSSSTSRSTATRPTTGRWWRRSGGTTAESGNSADAVDVERRAVLASSPPRSPA